jgi:hypothetical protein
MKVPAAGVAVTPWSPEPRKAALPNAMPAESSTVRLMRFDSSPFATMPA